MKLRVLHLQDKLLSRPKQWSVAVIAAATLAACYIFLRANVLKPDKTLFETRVASRINQLPLSVQDILSSEADNVSIVPSGFDAIQDARISLNLERFPLR